MKYKYKYKTDNTFAAMSLFCSICGLLIVNIAAYVTHIWWTISILLGPNELVLKTALLMGFGIIIPIIGMIHGWYIWFS